MVRVWINKLLLVLRAVSETQIISNMMVMKTTRLLGSFAQIKRDSMQNESFGPVMTVDSQLR